MKLQSKLLVASVSLLAAMSVQAANVQVTVTIENLANENSVSFAPFHFGIGNGSFDGFDIGSTANDSLALLAETGNGTDWLADFAAADAAATLGSVGGVLTPGSTASDTFVVDSSGNQYFTFASMVLPSNDFFIGNDSPNAYRIFDEMGNLLLNEITISANQVWDAGSEVFDPDNAAFVGAGLQRDDQNSVVALNFAELAAFNGLTTGAGYEFDSQLLADSEIYRISFEASPVPVPAALPLLGSAIMGLVAVGRRRLEA